MKTVKLFLTGDFNTGKTTIIEKCLAGYTGPLWGFRTYKHPKEGPAFVWLEEAAFPGQAHKVAEIQEGEGRVFYPEVFDRQGTSILQKIQPGTRGLVLMDEIGFIESKSPAFQREILRVLDLEIPVIGALRSHSTTPFLQTLRQRPDLTLYTVTAENRQEILQQCLSQMGQNTQPPG